MDNPCMTRVWKYSNQKGSPLLLLLAIASHADDNGFAFPSLRALAARIRMSRRQTMRLIARLEDAAELLVLRQPGRGNLYVVRTGASRQALAAALARAARFQEGQSTLCPHRFCGIIGPASPDPGLPGRSMLNTDD